MYLRLQADIKLKHKRADIPLLAHLQGLYIFLKENGLILNQELNSIKRTLWQTEHTHSSSTLRITSRRRWSDRILETKRWPSEHILSTLNIGLMMYGRARWQEAEATRKDFNTVLIRQEKKFFTSGLFKVIQDAIPLILHCRTMCWFQTISSSTFLMLDVQVSVRFITNYGLIAGGQNSSWDRQTVFFTSVNPMHQNHKDPQELELTKPRLASHKQKVEKAPRCGVLGRHTGCSTERIEVSSNKIERHHPLRYTPSLLYLESDCDETWRNYVYQKMYVSPRPPPKISYKDNWMCDLDSDIVGRNKDTQRIEPKPKTQKSSTERPVCGEERGNRGAYHIWSRHSLSRETWWSHRPNRYGETRMWTRIHKTLRVDT